MRLPALRLMSAAVTEELFFTGLIGNVQIDSIIPYILKMESTDYNSQSLSTIEWLKPCPQPHISWCQDVIDCKTEPCLFTHSDPQSQNSSLYDIIIRTNAGIILWHCFFILSVYGMCLMGLCITDYVGNSYFCRWMFWLLFYYVGYLCLEKCL